MYLRGFHFLFHVFLYEKVKTCRKIDKILLHSPIVNNFKIRRYVFYCENNKVGQKKNS